MGRTTLGAFHTAMGVIALVGGFSALARNGQISPTDRLGQTYLLTTLITA